MQRVFQVRVYWQLRCSVLSRSCYFCKPAHTHILLHKCHIILCEVPEKILISDIIMHICIAA